MARSVFFAWVATSAIVLFVAGFLKLIDPVPFDQFLKEGGLPVGRRAAVQLGVAGFELISASLLVFGTIRPRLKLVTGLVLFGSFASFHAWRLITGKAGVDCGCFGTVTTLFDPTVTAWVLMSMTAFLAGTSLMMLTSYRDRAAEPIVADAARVSAVRLSGTMPRGFTLLELMICISVIGALLALMFPMMLRAREQAKTVQCLSNLRQIGQASMVYAGSYRDYVLREGDPNPQNFDLFKPWPVMVEPMWADLWPVSLNEQVVRHRWLRCPAEDLDRRAPVGYAANGIAISNAAPLGAREAMGPTRLGQIRRASRTIHLAEMRYFFGVPGQPYPSDEQLWDNALAMNWPGYWDFWRVIEDLPEPVGLGYGINGSRHGPFRSNYLRFDSSAATLDSRTLVIRDFDDGIRSHPNRRPIPRPLDIANLPNGPGFPGVDPTLPVPR